MARLSWDAVAAPDFSGPSQGLQSAASMITQALRGAEEGVKDYNNILDGNVNRAFALELLKYQDPESYKAALAEGSIPGQDSRRLSAESIGAAGTRYNTLLGQAQTEFQMGRDKRIDGQAQAFDKNAGAIAELRRLSYTDEAAANAYAASRPDLFQGMGARDILSAVDANQSAVASGWNLKNTKQNYAQDGTEFGWRTEDRANGLIEKAAFDQLIGMDDKADQARALQGMTNLPAGSKAALWTQLGLPQAMDYSGFNAAGAIGTAATGGSSSAAFGAPQQAVASTLQAGGMPDNAVAGFLGNFHVEGGYSGAQGDGGSAGGIAQWRGARRDNFIKIIGVDPAKATAEQGAKFVLWEMNNPNSGAFVPKDGLSPAQQIAAIKNAKSPAEAAQLIDRYYERSDGKAINGRVAAANAMSQALTNRGAAVSAAVGRGSASMQTVAPSPVAEIFMRNAGKNGVGVRDAAKALVAADPTLDLARAESAIKDMMAEASAGFNGEAGTSRQINASMAADLIRHFSQSKGSRGFWDNTVRNFSSNFTGGEELGKDTGGLNPFGRAEGSVVYDRASVIGELNKYQNGEMEGVIRSEDERAGIAAQVQTAQQTLAAAQAKLTARQQRRAQGLPVSDAAIASDLIAVQNAQATLTALNSAGSDPRSGVELHGQRPKPPARVAPPAPRQASVTPKALPKAAAPKPHSSAAARGRAADMLGNAAMAINPIYWAGRLIDGR